MANLQAVGNIRRLNNQNYNTWSTCMEPYLQGQDLWEIVVGGETTHPKNVEAFRKWKIKAGKALFAIKTSIEEEGAHQARKHTKGCVGHLFNSIFKEK